LQTKNPLESPHTASETNNRILLRISTFA